MPSSELTARRIADLEKQKSSPEDTKRVSAWSNGLWAKREHRERRSSTMKNTWAELRTARSPRSHEDSQGTQCAQESRKEPSAS